MIYLDHAATSPLREDVLNEMLPWLGVPANPASPHQAGQRAAMAVENAREAVAALLGRPHEGIVFTSGATEANHLWWHALPELGIHRAATGRIEHPCILAAATRFASHPDAAITWLDAEPCGRTVLPEDTSLEALSLMAANHETGVLQRIGEAASWCQDQGALLHVDATHAVGKVWLDFGGVHAVSASSHKIGGPAGVGVLSLNNGQPFPAFLTGGGQERGRRSGTVPTASVVGMGAAARAIGRDLARQQETWAAAERAITETIIALGGRRIGHPEHVLSCTILCAFPGLRGDTLVQSLDLAGFAVSAGAACASGSLGPSEVLLAMGDPAPEGGVRISMGHNTTLEEVAAFCEALRTITPKAREAADW